MKDPILPRSAQDWIAKDPTGRKITVYLADSCTLVYGISTPFSTTLRKTPQRHLDEMIHAVTDTLDAHDDEIVLQRLYTGNQDTLFVVTTTQDRSGNRHTYLDIRTKNQPESQTSLELFPFSSVTNPPPTPDCT